MHDAVITHELHTRASFATKSLGVVKSAIPHEELRSFVKVDREGALGYEGKAYATSCIFIAATLKLGAASAVRVRGCTKEGLHESGWACTQILRTFWSLRANQTEENKVEGMEKDS
ncbi:hypothetical protein GOBAR_AA13998 [Gossypium barbadense]|uniref:Uncharacterized protein n=1 Tax=Gossypium barbadense TaxID=3634 RepID=A0A2P5XTK5_GOSBA|nr:hypothetical protein GOBAR_AA13998 [Gossypium barbadense]